MPERIPAMPRSALRPRLAVAAAAGLLLALSPLAATAAFAADDELTLAMAVDQEFAHSGSTLTYTLTVANSGPTTATGVTVTDQVPDALTVTGASNGGAIMPPGDVVEWPAFTIDAGDTLTLTMTAIINDGYTDTVITNTFSVAPVDGFTTVVTGACVTQDETCAQTEVQSRAEAEPEAPTLAATGGEAGIPALAAAVLLLAAGALLVARRRTA